MLSYLKAFTLALFIAVSVGFVLPGLFTAPSMLASIIGVIYAIISALVVWHGLRWIGLIDWIKRSTK